jgi:nitrous oxidase accessory protein
VILLFTLAYAGSDHELAAPAALAMTAGPIPDGPPRTVEVAPGTDIDSVLSGLPPGSTVHLLPGRHAGPVHIDRPLTLYGPATLVGPGIGSVVFVTAPDVTVRDLEVTGSGTDATAGDAGVIVAADRFLLERVRVVHTFLGIDLRQADGGVVRGCDVVGREEGSIGTHGDGIRLWESDDNEIAGNHLEHVRDMVVWYSNGNRIHDNLVEKSRYGVHFMHTERNEVVSNRFLSNVVGIFAMYSNDIRISANTVVGADGPAGMGIGLKECDDIEVVGNRLLASTVGLYLDHTPHRPDRAAVFRANTLAYNHTGIRLHGMSSPARFLGNDVHENRVQVAVDGGVRAGTAVFEGNRWSDYAGYDLDGDGIGDLAYAPQAFSRAIVERNPVATFFDGTPAALLLDLLAAAFPMWAPPPTLTDARPRLGRRVAE